MFLESSNPPGILLSQDLCTCSLLYIERSFPQIPAWFLPLLFCLIIAVILYPLTWLCFFHCLIFYYQRIDININNINTNKWNEFCLFVYWLSLHTRTSAPWGQGYMWFPCPEPLPLGLLQGHGRYSINTCRMNVWDKFWLESVVSILVWNKTLLGINQ